MHPIKMHPSKKRNWKLRVCKEIWGASQVARWVKTVGNAADTGDTDSVPGWGRSPGGGHGNSLQYSFFKK